MSKRDRQIQDPFEQRDGAEPIVRPEPESSSYQKIIWTAKDDVAPTTQPVVDRPADEAFEITEFTAVAPAEGGMARGPETNGVTLGYADIVRVVDAPPVQQAAGSTERSLSDDENVVDDVVGAAVDGGLAEGLSTEQPRSDDYLVITMEHVQDDALDG